MNPTPSVWFGPAGGITPMIARMIQGASHSIWVMMYEFNSRKLSDALGNAPSRGVSVNLIADATTTPRERAIHRDLNEAGVRIWLDARHKIMHNKFCIIDEATIITGSMNWTDQAENDHAENVVMWTDTTAAWQYIHNAETHLKHSQRYQTPVIAAAA